MDKLNRCLSVDRRFGVGDAGHAREPAGQRRSRAGLDCLVFLPARLAEVNVHVDEPGSDHEPGGVDSLINTAHRLGA